MNYYHWVETKCNESGITFYVALSESILFLLLCMNQRYLFCHGKEWRWFFCVREICRWKLTSVQYDSRLLIPSKFVWRAQTERGIGMICCHLLVVRHALAAANSLQFLHRQQSLKVNYVNRLFQKQFVKKKTFLIRPYPFTLIGSQVELYMHSWPVYV